MIGLLNNCILFISRRNSCNIRLLRQLAMETPVITVKQGQLRGTIRENVNGGEYFSFRGVPYAEPPVGELRFKEPQPLKPWSGIKDALKESKKSAQYDIVAKNCEGGDDCLYLDIATNSLTEKQPVIVWIHGGGFKQSSNTYKKYGPDYLLKNGITFVSLNYRLGILGFLNMEHEECAGNQGLKDQLAGLKWVKENIEAFGGDSNNITLMGESAGGASVHALCLTPQAKGLFHKAIIQSGVLSNPWAFSSTNKEMGYALAEALGKEYTSPLEVVNFLRTFPACKLVETYENVYKKEIENLLLHLVPSNDLKSSNPLLPDPIEELEENGIGVPLLIGYNSHEGILRFSGNTSGFIEEVNNNFDKVLALNLRETDVSKISSKCSILREFYFGKDEIDSTKINELVQFVGDLLFVSRIHKVVNIQAQKSLETFLYKFTYRPDYPGIRDWMKIKIEGTCHADEIGCLFLSEARRGILKKGTRDYKTMERMTKMWTNFAKTGNPTPVVDELITTKWLPFDKNNKGCLEIDDNLTFKENTDCEMWSVWQSFFKSLKK